MFNVHSANLTEIEIGFTSFWLSSFNTCKAEFHFSARVCVCGANNSSNCCCCCYAAEVNVCIPFGHRMCQRAFAFRQQMEIRYGIRLWWSRICVSRLFRVFSFYPFGFWFPSTSVCLCLCVCWAWVRLSRFIQLRFNILTSHRHTARTIVVCCWCRCCLRSHCVLSGLVARTVHTHTSNLITIISASSQDVFYINMTALSTCATS